MRVAAGAPAHLLTGSPAHRLTCSPAHLLTGFRASAGREGSGLGNSAFRCVHRLRPGAWARFPKFGRVAAGGFQGWEGGGGGHGGRKGPPGVRGEGVRGLGEAIARRDRDR
jgi:hypothetical protein